MKTSVDAFLGGQVTACQPLKGYRAATDPVFLAASVQAKPGQTVLDVGCGVGVASLCLNARVAGLKLSGLELQNDYAELAKQNAIENDIEFDVFSGDLLNPPAKLRKLSFDIVMTNPPYFPDEKGTKANDPSKATANSTKIAMHEWIAMCLKRVKPMGWLYVINVTDELSEILVGVHEKCGDIKILPIASRTQQPAKRVIVAARKGSKGAMQLLSPFVVHDGDSHSSPENQYSELANGILREGWILPLR